MVQTPIKLPPVQPQERRPGTWERGRPALGGRWKTWGAGILAGILVLLVIVLLPRRKEPIVPAPKPSTGVVEVTTVPAGAVVWVNGKERGPATQALPLDVAAGAIEIEARLPGFQSAGAKINLAAGGHSPVALTLAPVLTLKLLCSSDGRVTVNDEPPTAIQDGQYIRQFPIGDYNIKLQTGRTGSMSFSFKVVPDGPAIVTAPVARDVAALVVSNFGDHGSDSQRRPSGEGEA